MNVEQREVRIVLRNSTYFVMYVNRRKYQRLSAAQFSMNAWTPADIKAWLVMNKPELRLIED
jgi:hypothetical protein